MSSSLSWSLGALVLVALSTVLTRLAGSTTPFAAGGVTLLVVGALWWLWKLDESTEPSPISEYLAVGYGWAIYASLVFTWSEVGERWVDWFIMIPPISVIPSIVRALVRRSSRQSDRTAGILRALHRLVAAVFFMSAAFLVLTVLGMVLAPVPLTAAFLHLAAGRFYARQPDM